MATPLPASAPPVSFDPIYDLLCHLADLLPEGPLGAAGRMQLGAYLFPEARDLLRAVCSALTLDRGAFPDIAAEPQALRAQFERGADYLRLSYLLQDLSRRAFDAALRDNGAAVSSAIAIVQHARQSSPQRSAVLAPGFLDGRRRRLALRRAEAILKARSAPRSKARRAREKARGTESTNQDPEAVS